MMNYGTIYSGQYLEIGVNNQFDYSGDGAQ